MEAEIVDLAQWKKSHPPVIVCLNAALARIYGTNAIYFALCGTGRSQCNQYRVHFFPAESTSHP